MHANRGSFSDLTRRLVKDNAIPFLWERQRLCSCGGINSCKLCRGQGEYFEPPEYIKGVITNIKSKERQESQMAVPFGDATLIVTGHTCQIQKGDILTPRKQKWETATEVINLKQTILTYRPIKAENGITITDQITGELFNYRFNEDFTFDHDLFFGMKLFKRVVKFLKQLPAGAERFSIRYAYIPEFLAAEPATPIVSPTGITESKIALVKRTIPKDDENISEPEKESPQPLPMGFNSFEFN